MNKILLITFVLSLFFSCTEKKENEECEQNCSETDTTQHLIYAFISSASETDGEYSIAIDTIDYNPNANLEKSTRAADFDNAFSIINGKEIATDFKVFEDVEIITQTFYFDSTGNFEFNKVITLDVFLSFVKTDQWERFKYIPFEVIIKCNKVIKIKEIYIP